jgi:uncharacterized protein (AIM24 family)
MAVEHTTWDAGGPVPFRIHGSEEQVVELLLRPGQRVICQPDSFLVGGGGVRGVGINWGRRLLDPIVRTWSGEAGILQEFACQGEPARVFFSKTNALGRILHIRLRPGRSVVCQRGAFLVGTGNIDHGVAFARRLRAGLFGRQGFVFQKLSGDGDVFLQVQGTYIELSLEENRKVMVSTNNVLAFESSVGYDMQLSGGLLSLLSAQQGLFLSQLEGIGTVYVQSLDHGTFGRLAYQKRGKRDSAQPASPTQGQSR